jgi:hypothetical protein
MNVFQHLLFKLILKFCGKSLLLSMSVNFSLIHLDDVFHPFQTIVDSDGLGGSSMLEDEGEGVHDKRIF